MKKFFLILLSMVTLDIWAQPEPYPVDKTFIPELSFLQKQWQGKYRGVDPRSKKVLYISRELSLCEDMTFVNITYGGIIENEICIDSLLLKYEHGTYEYDKEKQKIIYYIQRDSSLAMDVYLSKDKTIKYITNRYGAGVNGKSYMEQTQFTTINYGERSWIMIDSKLGSDQEQGKPSVYLMNIKKTASNVKTITLTYEERSWYDLIGRKINSKTCPKGIVIRNGRKYIVNP